jgi:NDP-sugar pyrophosphorylase family protein/CheY-like chemotaxis protein
MQAIILAGGMGTRLRPLTYTLPKPMLPIAGRPALAHIVDALASAGCSEVIITTNYLAELIDEKLAGLDLPIPVSCVKEDKPLGTAGCIRNLYDQLENEFIVIQGDAVADMDYGAFLESHKTQGADVSISVMKVADTREFGICGIEKDGRISRFQEKPRPEEAFSNMANAGFYILRKELFSDIPVDTPYDFARQLFPKLMAEGKKFYAWEMKGFWIDIGRVGNYIEGNMHAIKGKAYIAPDVTIPDDTVLVAPYIIGSGCKIGSRCTLGPGAVIGSHVLVGDGVHITKSVVYDNVVLGSKTRLTDCVIAGKSHLGKDVCIEALAVVGESCDLGAGVQLGAHSKVGPITPVAAGTLIEGVLEPRLQKLSGLQRIATSGPIMEKLMPDEREVYATLAEYGELSAREIAETSSLPLLRVMAVLHSLEKQELALSTQDHPRRYALTREEQVMPRRILIVDDSANALEVMRLVFTTQGHSIRTASDGIEAIEAVREERFDAVIMDTDMPNLNGWDATRLIRGMPNGRNIPVVLFTSSSDKEGNVKMREVGANGLLDKSVQPEEMLPQVMQYIKK